MQAAICVRRHNKCIRRLLLIAYLTMSLEEYGYTLTGVTAESCI